MGPLSNLDKAKSCHFQKDIPTIKRAEIVGMVC
jgi:hypothetical protein